jgi:hypothetical protein
MKNRGVDATYIRSACRRCGQQLEFPAHAVCSGIKCPVCGTFTRFHRTPEPSPLQKSQPKVHFEGADFDRKQQVFIWVLGAVIVAIIVGFAILQSDKSPDFGNYNSQVLEEDKNVKEWDGQLQKANAEFDRIKPETNQLIPPSATNLPQEK